MKVFWNDLKLKFKEQLRVVGKYDLNKPNDYMVKRRQFKDIDISKDFEKRLNIKKIEQAQENIEKKRMQLQYDKMSLDQLETYREDLKIKEEDEKTSDLYQKVLIQDVQKTLILATIRSHEFFDKFFEDTQLHPEMRKNLEIIEHGLKYNQPIEKRVLYEAMPEMFLYEIGKLTEDERRRFRRRRYEFSTSDGVLSTGEQYQMAILNREYEVDKLNEMNFYLHFQKKDFYDKYYPFLMQALGWGWETPGVYLYSLRIKDKDKLTSIEKTMLEEMKELDLIEEEIMTLQDAIYNREPEMTLPFPMDEPYKSQYIAMLEHVKKFQTIDINDTCIIPFQLPEETFMDRLKKIPGVDIDEEIKKSNESILKTINSGLALKGRDLNAKDPELIRQVGIVSQAVQVEKSPMQNKIAKYDLPLDYLEEGLLGQTPTDGRILIEEYYKVLYLNNEDPEKYNFAYWEKYFNVSKVTLRNIFNYIFFPLPDEKNPNEVGKILYFKDVEFEKRRKMISEMTGDEYKEYLEHTQERPELQEVNRLEYLVYQTTSTEPRITERTVPTDDLEIDSKIGKELLYSEVIEEIDSRIQKLVSGQLDSSTNESLIEKDVQLQIDQIKLKRIEMAKLETKKLEESKDVMSKKVVESLISLNNEIKLIKDTNKEPEIVVTQTPNENNISEEKTVNQTINLVEDTINKDDTNNEKSINTEKK